MPPRLQSSIRSLRRSHDASTAIRAGACFPIFGGYDLRASVGLGCTVRGNLTRPAVVIPGPERLIPTLIEVGGNRHGG